MTTIIAIQSCNSCLNQSHKYIDSCVVAMYDYNNIATCCNPCYPPPPQLLFLCQA